MRTLGRLADPAQFNEIAVATRGPYVGEAVATSVTPKTAQEEPPTAARLNGESGGDADRLASNPATNTVATADAVKERLKEIAADAAARTFTSQMVNDQSHFHQGRGATRSKTHLIEGSFLAAADHFPFPGQHPHHADRRGRDSDLHHLHLRADGGHGLHAEPDHHAGADADGRHRDRRRHHRARKYLPLHRRKGHAAVRRRRWRAPRRSAWR